MCRKKLKTKLGKRVQFTGTLGRESDKTKGRYILTDIKYEGKVVSDHNWLMLGNINPKFTEGDYMSFIAFVGRYDDTHGVQSKLGLQEVSSFMLAEDALVNKIITHNKKHRVWRGRTKYKR